MCEQSQPGKKQIYRHLLLLQVSTGDRESGAVTSGAYLRDLGQVT